MYLVDTNVVSETRKPRPHGAVLEWIGTIPDELLFLSAVTLGEFQRGIERTRVQAPEKANEIEGWVSRISRSFEIIPVDGEIFREWARMMHGHPEQKWQDVLIAATARLKRLAVATRNIKDFEGLGVELINPFEYSSGRNS